MRVFPLNLGDYRYFSPYFANIVYYRSEKRSAANLSHRGLFMVIYALVTSIERKETDPFRVLWLN